MVAILGLVLVAGLLALWPAVRVEQLSRTLTNTEAADEAAQVAAQLLRTEQNRAIQAIAKYAAANALRAFDPGHEILLIHDPVSGETHEVYVGPSGERVDTGDPGLDRAIEEALPEITARRFSIGDPPVVFSKVRLVESNADYAEFALEDREQDSHRRVRFNFDGERRTGIEMLGPQ